VVADCQKSNSSTVSNLNSNSESTRIVIFKIVILLDGLGSLMICTHALIVLTKTKETIHYCESFGYGGRNTLTNVSNDLTHVSVPAEDRSIIPIMGISLHPHHGHFAKCPTAKHKQPNNLINRKEGTHKP
jgi:hypothetical protein